MTLKIRIFISVQKNVSLSFSRVTKISSQLRLLDFFLLGGGIGESGPSRKTRPLVGVKIRWVRDRDRLKRGKVSG